MTTKAIIRKNRKNANGECLVYIQYGHGGRSTLFSTGIHVETRNWYNGKVRLLKGLAKTKANEEIIEAKEKEELAINNSIDVKISNVNRAVQKLMAEEIPPTLANVRAKWNELYGDKPEPENLNFIQLVEQFIEAAKDQRANRTIDAYNGTVVRLKGYLIKKHLNPKVEDIDMTFFEGFKGYLHSLNQMKSTVGKHVKTFKTFLNYLDEKDYDLNIKPGRIKMKEFRDEKPIIYLTQEEFDQLYKFDFSKNKRLEKARDLFALGCCTGLRISDLKRLGPQHIQGGIIQMKAFKTGKDVYCPLTPRAVEILDKYSFRLPALSDQKLNEYIKDACEEAEINSPVERIAIRKGKKIITKVPKHELISSHVAVKTFITHCGQLGISPKVVAEITGKNVKVLLDRYYGSDKDTIVREMERGFGKAVEMRVI